MMSLPDESIRRKRLLWRATHRGIKEMDLIVGGFVTRHLDDFSFEEIAELERIMDIPDQELLAWATRQAEIPAAYATPLLARMIAHSP